MALSEKVFDCQGPHSGPWGLFGVGLGQLPIGKVERTAKLADFSVTIYVALKDAGLTENKLSSELNYPSLWAILHV